MRQTVRFQGGQGNEARLRQGLLHLVHDLNSIANSLSLSKEVRTRAGSIVTDAQAMRFCRVTAPPVLEAAALYVACREFKEPMTLRELASATGTDPREVGRCYDNILVRMHITRPSLNGRSYVHHLALKLPFSEEIYRTSEDIIKRTTKAGLGGRNPMTLAAAALYLACCGMGEKVTQAEVADAAGVGEESVRECCKAIRAYENMLPHEPPPSAQPTDEPGQETDWQLPPKPN